MIAEFLGAGGVGKSTVEPLVSDRLRIAYYPGKKRHGFYGEPLPAWAVWWGRVASVGSRPGLVLASIRAHYGPIGERIRFANDLARRDRTARRAARLGSGVVASGPLHGLVMAAAGTGSDLSKLTQVVTLADVYVMLSTEPEVIQERLSTRLTASGFDDDLNPAWIAEYEQAALSLLDAANKPVVRIDASAEPDQVAKAVAERLQSLLERR